ncbi:ERF family protein [Thalassospira alkalitolerans]|uniref:ERF family protein n=1 Tax=Thalassospira alkalitolerans TaxID=1293890 RepID=UPI003AA850A5
MTDKQEVATTEERSVAAQDKITPLSIIVSAVERGMDAAQLHALMDFQDRMDAKEAKKSYLHAMAEFKKNCPEIYKNKRVSYEGKNGGKPTEYMHETLDHIVNVAAPVMAENGLSHTWETDQLDGGMIQVTCVITHSDGHSTRTTLQSGRDDSGGKNNIQALGSAVKYLQRYTFLSATGLASREEDDDGRATGSVDPEISAAHHKMLLEKIEEVKSAVGFDEESFFKAFKIDDYDQLTEFQFSRALPALNKKLAGADKGQAA